MDNLETPYDVEAEFIECTVCEKSIRGDTLYKIHLTTPGHIKKEESSVTAGLAVRKQTIPEFQDILQYLDYLKLDEPIIGLDYLEEVPSNEPQASPRYICRLCHLTANLPEMVHHVIGRKHRQKYVEIKRPDLVTWDKQSLTNQGGKIIRARAEIIERQDGRGNPVPMTKRRIEVPPRHKQRRDQNFSQSFTHQNLPSLLPELTDYKNKNKYPRQGCSNTPSFHPDKSYNDRQMYQWEERPQRDHVEEDLRSGDYRNNNMYTQEYMDSGNFMEYKEEYTEEPQGRGGGNRYDPWNEAGMPYGQTQHEENYPEEASTSRRPYQEREPLKDFSEEVRSQQDHSEYQPLLQMYPEDKRQWSPDRESDRHVNMRRASRQGLNEPEGSFPTPMENEQKHHRLFNIIKDYQHKLRVPYKEVAVSNSGPSRSGPPSSQRRVDVAKTISGIPEPFKRFLTGMTDSEGYGKRKRKSRFSDATAEEVEMTREMLRDQFEPPNPKFGRPAGLPMRPESHATQHPDHYSESQSPCHSESYHEGGSGSVDVFDLLKGIEIENAEEADFLKNKLCSLLKEFKSKKMENALQKSHDGAIRNNDYNPQSSVRYQYERTVREDSDLRPSFELSFKDGGRGKGWMQHDYVPDEQLQEHHHSVNKEPAYSHRKAYEEAFGKSEMPDTPHGIYSDEPERQTERFQELMYPHDYQEPAENYLDSHATPSPLHREDNSRIPRGPHYSKNLDKITCTLLELVSRKKKGDF